MCSFDYIRDACGLMKTDKDGQSGAVELDNPYPNNALCSYDIIGRCQVITGTFSNVEIEEHSQGYLYNHIRNQS